MLAALQPGDPQRIGSCQLVARLGSGGMGEVFLGRSADGRMVAVKVIRSDLAADRDFRVRFRREVAAAQKVGGRFTAQVIDADVDGPVPWLATAYVAGPSLAEAVTSYGPLPVASVRALAAGLTEGLSAIHAAGVIHRDLKPANVLLAEDRPRVIDFGISRAAEATTLTQTGLAVGTPGYMSPEQVQGRQVGPASDIFSLGAVLVFAATGQGPFGTGQSPELGYRVVYEPPGLDQVPAELRPLLGRCLAKDPGQRPTAGDLLADLGGATPATDWLPAPVTRTITRYEQQEGDPGTERQPRRPGTEPGHTRVMRTPFHAGARPLKAGALVAVAVVLAAAGTAYAAGLFRGPHAGTGAVPPTASSGPAAYGARSSAAATPTQAASPANTLGAAPPVREISPAFTVGRLGASAYIGGGYSAAITSATAAGFTLSVAFDAVGQDDLRDPVTSCVQVSGPDGAYTFGPLDSTLTVDQPGHYSGVLTFPLTVAGSYSFTYSCQADYSAVPLGAVTLSDIGVSDYTGNVAGSPYYEATVISSASANGHTVVYFAATGPTDLRDPGSSCLQPGTSPVGSPAYDIISNTGTLDELIIGTLNFRGTAPATFQYACTSVYTTVQIPGGAQ